MFRMHGFMQCSNEFWNTVLMFVFIFPCFKDLKDFTFSAHFEFLAGKKRPVQKCRYGANLRKYTISILVIHILKYFSVELEFCSIKIDRHIEFCNFFDIFVNMTLFHTGLTYIGSCTILLQNMHYIFSQII